MKERYPYVDLDEFIIMPNHIHGIIIINDSSCRDKSRPVPTAGIKIKSLSQLVGAFKTTSSKLIHENGLEKFAWQRSFYDHIIRNEKSLTQIRNYIRYNPMKWGEDRNNLKNNAAV